MPQAADFFRRLAREIPKMEKEIAAQIIAVEAEQFHAKNFRDEGFTDKGFQPWARRKKHEEPRRALLVKTGAMKGHAVRGRIGNNEVQFIFPLEYMKVHNEGGRAGRGAGFQMPQRQFVGESDYLTNRIIAKATAFINARLNKI